MMKILRFHVLTLAVGAMLMTSAASVHAQNQPTISLKFVNQTSSPATLYWLADDTPQGKKAYGVLPPNQEGTVATYPMHKWLFTNGTQSLNVVATKSGTHTLKAGNIPGPMSVTTKPGEVVITFQNLTTATAEVATFSNPQDRNTRQLIKTVPARGTFQAASRVGQYWEFTSKGGFGATGFYVSKAETVKVGANLKVTFKNRTAAPAQIYLYTDRNNANAKQLKGTLQAGQDVTMDAIAGETWGISNRFAGAGTAPLRQNETLTIGQNVPTPKPDNSVAQSKLNMLILQKINNYRVSQGRGKLRFEAHIQGLTQSHSQDMANRYNGQFQIDHNGAQQRFQSIQQNDNTTMGFAENVFCCANGTDEQIATQAFNGWKNSPGHNTNMLEASYTVTGLSAVKKNGVVYVTQMFSASKKPAPPVTQ